jgi:hypothetical protein
LLSKAACACLAGGKAAGRPAAAPAEGGLWYVEAEAASAALLPAEPAPPVLSSEEVEAARVRAEATLAAEAAAYAREQGDPRVARQ